MARSDQSSQPSAEDAGWALVFHQGLPVALCPVTAWEGGALELVCGGMEVETQARLQLQFTGSDGGAQGPGRQAATVEGVRQGRIHLRLEGDG